jgi:hypothetical protein
LSRVPDWSLAPRLTVGLNITLTLWLQNINESLLSATSQHDICCEVLGNATRCMLSAKPGNLACDDVESYVYS